MNVLLLGSPDTKIARFLNMKEELIVTQKKIDLYFVADRKIDFIVSYNYPHIVDKSIIKLFGKKIINLHISLLPWNRGADPNFWSFYDDTPKGVSIHCMSPGLDEGDILLQKEVEFSDEETFSSSYDILQNEIQSLFIENWDKLKEEKINSSSQGAGGSYHRRADKRLLFSQLPNGWDTRISEFKEIFKLENPK